MLKITNSKKNIKETLFRNFLHKFMNQGRFLILSTPLASPKSKWKRLRVIFLHHHKGIGKDLKTGS